MVWEPHVPRETGLSRAAKNRSCARFKRKELRKKSARLKTLGTPNAVAVFLLDFTCHRAGKVFARHGVPGPRPRERDTRINGCCGRPGNAGIQGRFRRAHAQMSRLRAKTTPPMLSIVRRLHWGCHQPRPKMLRARLSDDRTRNGFSLNPVCGLVAAGAAQEVA